MFYYLMLESKIMNKYIQLNMYYLFIFDLTKFSCVVKSVASASILLF